ncbi:MAG: tetratricopeptide repeat protein [Myxococcota bacterium]
MATVVVSSFKVTSFPEGGGHFWVYMQYIHALRSSGCEVYWLEQFHPSGDPDFDDRALATFRERVRAFGLEGKVLLYRSIDDDGGREWLSSSESEAEAVLRGADLLLNFHYAIHPSLLALPKRTALVDIDPGLLQLWIDSKLLVVPPHDLYLTTGETVGIPGSPFPDCGVDWIHFHPVVCLDLWPYSFDPACESFTTVSGWSANTWIPMQENGREVLKENTKRVSFLEFKDLPRHTDQPLELALNLADSDLEERCLLESRGWRIRHSHGASSSPETYQRYIQRSRGELSCARPSCIWFQNAWVSDRTACYLASGKPVVVQHTGPSAFLPDGEGMFRFKSIQEAAQALERINADYPRHCRAARELAEAYFDANQAAERILNAALSGPLGPKDPSAPAPPTPPNA